MTTKEPAKSLMNAIVGIMVGALIISTIEKCLPELALLVKRQPKLKKISMTLNKIMKRHNPRRFTMMKAKRSCKHDSYCDEKRFTTHR
jgi:uncharacterized membrane protein YkvI